VTPPTNTLAAASSISAHVDARFGAEQMCAEVASRLGPGPVDLVLFFATASHLGLMAQVGAMIGARLGPRCLLGVSCESVVGGDVEIERSAGLSMIALRLPGVRLHPFTAAAMIEIDMSADDGLDRLGRAFGAGPDLRATILLVDPFSVPLVNMLPAMCAARDEGRVGAILGAMASASPTAGGNLLMLNDRVFSTGAVGVSISGPVRIDSFVSQGCRPIGDNYVITGAKRNLITHLGGRPVVEVLQHLIEPMDEHDKELLQRGGLLIGRVVTEYKERFGQGDYLIRNVMNVNPQMGAMGVADLVRVGQTIRFHVRDAQAAHDDLAMMLDAQKLHGRPVGALAFTCNGRGTNLFPEPSHDAWAIAHAFDNGEDGSSSEQLPVAGFFGAGEIGPIGDESFVHGHSVAVALFRELVGE
jgi:small ligand-binding sensory domain FIST